MRRQGHRGLPAGGATGSLVFTTVLTDGPLSRTDVADRTGLSPAAVTRAIRPLADAGYLTEEVADDSGSRRVGRPVTPVRVRAERCFFAGVKVTADELIGVVTDLEATVRAVRHRPLVSHEVGDVLADLVGMVGDLLAESAAYRRSFAGLGVSVGGDVDPESGIVRYAPFLGWRQVPFVSQVSSATDLPVHLDNDVRALTVAEQWFGSGVGAESFAVVTVGTGIGCALFVNGKVVTGARGVAGEIGHLVVDRSGPLCHCGNRGCVEAIASNSAILAQVGAVTGREVTDLDTAIELARNDFPGVRQVFAVAGHAIGTALAAVANLVGPERIVISGEGLAAYDLFEEQIRTIFVEQAFGAAGECDLIVRPLSFDDWARGAAAVAIQRFIAPHTL
ncbi:MAG TPA: ROK family transcriptional regulator [Amycolatopsis sp.]|nr:ROK family transcriptional regulator [Amycolatopsis sp.]